MNALTVTSVSGADLLGLRASVGRVYEEAFTGPPWQGAGDAGGFLARLQDDVLRPGFTAAVAFEAGSVVGFATAWTTPARLPPGRCYPQAGAALGPERTKAWLCGAREVDELAVTAAARHRGTGSALLEAVTDGASDGRCWLSTPVGAVHALSFYRRQGWVQATHPAPEGAGHTVLLGPRHPARTAVPLAL
ncbi:GNAT family N-acetyltransferase [Streptomyces sp. NPDC004111]|uniref:GNAT family N-acetyltransferase n=1 Tax=Streptomyces sp. NPDC004111 TaxID=3364690 RepID=UPI0036D0306B